MNAPAARRPRPRPRPAWSGPSSLVPRRTNLERPRLERRARTRLACRARAGTPCRARPTVSSSDLSRVAPGGARAAAPRASAFARRPDRGAPQAQPTRRPAGRRPRKHTRHATRARALHPRAVGRPPRTATHTNTDAGHHTHIRIGIAQYYTSPPPARRLSRGPSRATHASHDSSSRVRSVSTAATAHNTQGATAPPDTAAAAAHCSRRTESASAACSSSSSRASAPSSSLSSSVRARASASRTCISVKP